MVIANPIYDTVFKRLMENKRVARFFVETLTGEQIEEIAMVPQEYTYHSKAKKKKKENDTKEDWEILSVIRFDFVATIRNTEGENKKVLIEIQKSSKSTDLMRFRTYLGEQYKRMDMVEVNSGKVEKALPVISIYLLGFTIPKIKATAIKVNRTYIDMIGQTEIKQKSEWIEALTHDGYFIQIPLVKGKPRTSLEKVLSIFEQQYFIDDKKTIKDYEYPVDNDNVKTMIEVLRHAAADTKTKREMEEAWWADQNEKEYEKMDKELKETVKAFEETTKAYKETTKAYKETTKAYEESKRLNVEKDELIAEKEKTIVEKEKEIAEKAIESARKMLKKGISIEDISDITNLPKQQIEQLLHT